jgi:hypothetical protein
MHVSFVTSGICFFYRKSARGMPSVSQPNLSKQTIQDQRQELSLASAFIIRTRQTEIIPYEILLPMLGVFDRNMIKSNLNFWN